MYAGGIEDFNVLSTFTIKGSLIVIDVGEGKRWLTMENVANAKTAKQAEADWILGIGKTHDTALEYVRHFHLSKNKLSGDADTEPEMRHGKADVLIKPLIARYEDMEF